MHVIFSVVIGTSYLMSAQQALETATAAVESEMAVFDSALKQVLKSSADFFSEFDSAVALNISDAAETITPAAEPADIEVTEAVVVTAVVETNSPDSPLLPADALRADDVDCLSDEIDAREDDVVQPVEDSAVAEVNLVEIDVVEIDVVEIDVVEIDVVETDVVETDVVETDVVETDVVETDVVDTDVVDTDVAETDVADTDVADTDVAETDVAETDVADTDVADTDVADTDVADTDVADTDVADTDVADTDVADTDVADTDVADTDVADTDVVDGGGGETASIETKAIATAAAEVLTATIEKEGEAKSAQLTNAWPDLSEHTRATILMLIEADQMMRHQQFSKI